VLPLAWVEHNLLGEQEKGRKKPEGQVHNLLGEQEKGRKKPKGQVHNLLGEEEKETVEAGPVNLH